MQELKIHHPSRDLLVRALTTLPGGLPFESDITMSADGLPTLRRKSLEARVEYFGQCKERRVIPFSYAEFRLFSTEFIPDTYKNMQLNCHPMPDADQPLTDREEALYGFLHGGRTHLINVKMDKDGFEAFRGMLLGKLLEAGYQPRDGYLDLSPSSATIGFDTDLVEPNGGNNLWIRWTQEGDEERDLHSWFKALSK